LAHQKLIVVVQPFGIGSCGLSSCEVIA
jgi:hypothetical protein